MQHSTACHYCRTKRTVCLPLSQQGPAARLLLVQERGLVVCQQLLLALLQKLFLANLVEVSMHALRLLLQSFFGLQFPATMSACDPFQLLPRPECTAWVIIGKLRRLEAERESTTFFMYSGQLSVPIH
jgi:hypothetical protein